MDMCSRALYLLCTILFLGSGLVDAYDAQNLQSAAAWNNKGVALFSMGDVNGSIQALDMATKLNPEYAEAWNNKGIVLSSMIRYNESIQAFETAIELSQKYYAETQNVSTLNITITKPGNVSSTTAIYGTSSGEVPRDHYIWILVNPSGAPGIWYPQGDDHLILTPDGTWNWQVNLGGDLDADSYFNIAAALVDKETDQEFQNWLDRGKVSKTFPGWRLPDTAKILYKITVFRNE